METLNILLLSSPLSDSDVDAFVEKLSDFDVRNLKKQQMEGCTGKRKWESCKASMGCFKI